LTWEGSQVRILQRAQMITLGIETSCDETALALIETKLTTDKAGGYLEYRVIQSLIHSQAELHSAYGGVFPSLAKREHGKNLVPLLHKLLLENSEILNTIQKEISASKTHPIQDSEFREIIEAFRAELRGQNPDLIESTEHAEFLKNIPPIDRIAITEGPGLEPALWVGINFCKLLSNIWKIPVVPINHMEGHIVGSLLESDKPYGTWQRLKLLPLPAIALLISGGHTELVKIEDQKQRSERKDEVRKPETSFRYTIIGQTKDDAVGEAFDKVARLLGLSYPGGPHISRLSQQAIEEKIESSIRLPRPMIKSGDLDFSFSGLKTAVLYAVRKHSGADGKLTDIFKKGLAREFEIAVTETLDAKLQASIEKINARAIIVGGGVSANNMLREQFLKTAKEFAIPVYLPSRHISGDNALMIALAGAMRTSTNHCDQVRAQGTKRLDDQ
jgi:N6-L-threonylcarbamoyladenine synthase